MRMKGRSGWWPVLGIFIAGTLSGCAGMEFAPKRQVWYYHQELPAADRAVEAARASGKDKECPGDFQAAEKMKKEAYEIYWSCRTQEGIAKANEAAAKAKALCPAKAAAVPAPKPAAPPPYPSASISANPKAVIEGQCATLTWSSENVTKTTIEPGVGDVSPGGSKEVCPPVTTDYQLTATGAGGTIYEFANVAVNPKPAMAPVAPPPPPPAVVKAPERMTLHINFDTNRADIRKADVAELQKAIDFVKRNPGKKIAVVGYTDDRGNDKYNQKLSERRAQAVQRFLVEKGGVKADLISAFGKGEADPVGDNKTEKGRFENRRVEVVVAGE